MDEGDEPDPRRRLHRSMAPIIWCARTRPAWPSCRACRQPAYRHRRSTPTRWKTRSGKPQHERRAHRAASRQGQPDRFRRQRDRRNRRHHLSGRKGRQAPPDRRPATGTGRRRAEGRRHHRQCRRRLLRPRPASSRATICCAPPLASSIACGLQGGAAQAVTIEPDGSVLNGRDVEVRHPGT